MKSRSTTEFQRFFYYDKLVVLIALRQMVKFRQIFDEKTIIEINELIFAPKSDKSNDDNNGNNKGTLIIDCTCCPSDITYPQDINLLDGAREITEEIIDELHKPNIGKNKKPRTYRKKAKKSAKSVRKNKKRNSKKIRQAKKEQINFIRRNLETISKMQEHFDELTPNCFEKLMLAYMVYEQQLYMLENNTHSVPNRIVSLSQSWVRPIIRGKASADTEFGAKVSLSVINGYCFVT